MIQTFAELSIHRKPNEWNEWTSGTRIMSDGFFRIEELMLGSKRGHCISYEVVGDELQLGG
jgi:hypothetical protein